MSEKLLTAEDLAELLRISRGSLYNLRYFGGGPPTIKVGGRLRWRHSDVVAWLDDQRSEGRGP